jgi:NADPH:quinone reductase-like Zn-dependent oxidoreductase
MRAAQVTTSGSSAVRVVDAEPPAPGDDEVLVAVAAVSVNQLDFNVMRGVGPGASASLPRTVGIDPAGTIVATGAGVDASAVGRRVVIKPGICCGACQFCRDGHEANCPSQRIVGVHRDGGAAELVAVPYRNAFEIDDLDFGVASAAVHSVPIAAHAIAAAGGVRAGSTVLVTGGFGSVGSAAAQLAVRAGAKVYVAGRTVRAAVDGVIPLSFQNPGELAAAARAAAPKGVDLVVDASGHGGVLAAAISVLGWTGRAVTCSASVEACVTLDSRSFYLRRNTLTGVAGADDAEVAECLRLVRDGIISVAVDSVHPLTRIGDAHRRFQAPGKTGKVVVDVA